MKQTYRDAGKDLGLINWRKYKKLNNHLSRILTKEIRDEINREVVKEIMKIAATEVVTDLIYEANNKKGA